MKGDELIDGVAPLLSQLKWKVVYLGGSTTFLQLTDPSAPAPELTDDVDVVVDVASPVEFQVDLRQKLRDLGAKEDTSEDAPTCRWLIGPLKVDIMTPNADILGFANSWYALAIESSRPHCLKSGTQIQLIAAPVFLATKLEAYLNRGKGDVLSSKDVEDIIALLDGRLELADEFAQAPSKLQDFVRAQLKTLRDDVNFLYAVEGYLHEAPSRAQSVFSVIARILQEGS